MINKWIDSDRCVLNYPLIQVDSDRCVLLSLRLRCLHGSIHSDLQTSATSRLNRASTHGVVSGYMCCVFVLPLENLTLSLAQCSRDNCDAADNAAGDGDGDDICGGDDVITITITSDPTPLTTEPRERNVREVKCQILLTTSD